ncbi:MAG: helix-turn-helix transcriptional regulator [Clostridia bacterium]|nr:helix-turn-helix transcriptional regulator [Clostridia bacterium]
MSISNVFQNRITELVEDCEVKKSELPNLIGVDYRSLSNALNYGIIPTPRILIRIADYFNVSIKYLLGTSNDEYFSKSKVKSDFKTRFDFLCKENNITFYKVSKDLHFDQSYITRWFNKNYLPSLELLDLISDYFEVSVDYLLGRTDDETPYK